MVTETLYNYGDSWHRDCVEYIKENMNLFKKTINEKYPNVSICKSQALYMLWIDLSKILDPFMDVEKLCIDKMHLKIAEGKRFGKGDQYNTFVRINFACPRFIVYEVLERMDKVFKNIEEGSK